MEGDHLIEGPMNSWINLVHFHWWEYRRRANDEVWYPLYPFLTKIKFFYIIQRRKLLLMWSKAFFMSTFIRRPLLLDLKIECINSWMRMDPSMSFIPLIKAFYYYKMMLGITYLSWFTTTLEIILHMLLQRGIG